MPRLPACRNNAEGVRQFQPRVSAEAKPWVFSHASVATNPERVLPMSVLPLCKIEWYGPRETLSGFVDI
jgi:hypothetical protein